MSAVAQDAAFLRKLSVLFVDDDSDILDGIGVFLGRRVAQVAIARNGAEGLAAFKACKPALVITDIRMPIMDGLSMIQEIRVLDPDVPIIVTTAFEQTDYMARAIELRVDRYVVKPVDPGRLEAALLGCARLLRAEVELAEKHRMEVELERLHHESSQRILASGLAHDYNNLLQAILATGQAASMNVPAGSPAHLLLGTMQQYVEVANRLGRQLMTRPERGISSGVRLPEGFAYGGCQRSPLTGGWPCRIALPRWHPAHPFRKRAPQAGNDCIIEECRGGHGPWRDDRGLCDLPSGRQSGIRR